MRQEKTNYSIKRMARLLKVSRSGYYKWPHTQNQQAAGNDEREAYMAEVDHKIRQIFNDSGCVYGSPRVTAELACRYRITLNRKTVAKRMRLMGLEGISPRMFAPVKAGCICASYETVIPAACWVGPWTASTTLISWSVRCGWRTRCAAAVLTVWSSTLTAARSLRVGRTGVCFDDAMAELFWSTLKTEFYNRRRFATRDEAKKAVAWWIEVIYNRKRRHSALGMQSPVAFENQINHHNQKSTAA